MQDVPERYAAFITEKDFFGLGLPFCPIERRLAAAGGRVVPGRAHMLYANGSCRNEATPTGRLMHGFFCEASSGMHYKTPAERARCVKEDGRVWKSCAVKIKSSERKAWLKAGQRKGNV